MHWEILSTRWKVEGGCYSITLAYDSDNNKAYVARFCCDPWSDPTYCGANRTNNHGLGHASNIFEATEICKKDAIAYRRKQRD